MRIVPRSTSSTVFSGASWSALKRRQEPPAPEYLHQAFHSSVVLGDILYIDGGDITMRLPNGTALSMPNNETQIIDLSKSWDRAVDLEIGNIPKGTTPALNLLALWPAADNRSFYAFGGIQSAIPTVQIETIPARTLSQFAPDGKGNGTWQSVTMAPGSIFPSLTRPAGALTATGNGKGYMLGGFSASNNIRSGHALPGLLTYGMASNQWTNDTATGFSDPGTAILGAMEFLHNFGTEGVLVAFGGQTADPGPIWFDSGANLLDFREIYVYDIGSKTWHHQRASEAIPDSVPAPRDMFCTAIVPSDNGGYEIYVYGGQTGNFVYGPGGQRTQALRDANAALIDVHVLTIPGFAWFRADDRSAAARTGHTCEVVGKRQMLSIGGLDPSAETIRVSGNQTDPFSRGLGVFDLVDWRWKDNYDANAPPYARPATVREWYSQNNNTVPWSDPALQAIFTHTPNSTQPPASTPSSAASDSSSGTNVGAIAGGVVGGIVGLAALLLVVFLLTYLRRQRATGQPPPWAPKRRKEEFRHTVQELEDPSSPDGAPSYSSRGYPHHQHQHHGAAARGAQRHPAHPYSDFYGAGGGYGWRSEIAESPRTERDFEKSLPSPPPPAMEKDKLALAAARNGGWRGAVPMHELSEEAALAEMEGSPLSPRSEMEGHRSWKS